MKNTAMFILAGLLVINLCGCAVLFVGAAGSAGTAVWLSGKLTQQFNASYERTILASKRALESLKLELVKETKEENVTQFRSNYTDGKEIWIDIRRVSENSTKVEVRVGAVSSDKEAASKILKSIERHL